MRIEARAWFFGILCMLPGSGLMAIETTIKGGSMELIQNGEWVHFKGGVELERDHDRLVAQEMKTTKERDQITAWGKVRLFRKMTESETLQGFGHKGFYSTKKGSGYLLGARERAEIHYQQILPQKVVRDLYVFANQIDFVEEKTRAVAKGNVYGKTRDPETKEFYEFWADKADYFGDEKKIILTGETKPIIQQTLGADRKEITGEVLTYFMDSRKIVAERKAEAVHIGKKGEQK